MAWRLSNTLVARICEEDFEAIANYGKPEILNRDQRPPFTGSAWICPLTGAKIKISMPLGDLQLTKRHR